jgi:hypothetical protein
MTAIIAVILTALSPVSIDRAAGINSAADKYYRSNYEA